MIGAKSQVDGVPDPLDFAAVFVARYVVALAIACRGPTMNLFRINRIAAAHVATISEDELDPTSAKRHAVAFDKNRSARISEADIRISETGVAEIRPREEPPDSPWHYWLHKGAVFVTKGAVTPREVMEGAVDCKVTLDEERRRREDDETIARAKAVDRERKRQAELAWAKAVLAGEEPGTANQRQSIPERSRIEVWNRDGGKCARCDSRERLEFDHIVPVSRGGSNTTRNLELLCEKCNRSKGAGL